MDNRNRRESAFLKGSPGTEVKPLGAGIVKFRVMTKEPAPIVLNRVRSVLSVIDETAMVNKWPDDAAWTARLPKWFVAGCAPTMTEREANSWLIKWNKMSAVEKAKAEEEKAWSIDNWLYWMQPENRQWYWWDAEAVEEVAALVAIEVEAWPFPWGSLKWLLKVAGATSVESVD